MVVEEAYEFWSTRPRSTRRKGLGLWLEEGGSRDEKEGDILSKRWN